MPKDLVILFEFFAVFVFINFAIYLLLHARMKERIFRELASYWLLVLMVFIVEGGFQTGNFNLSVVFIFNIFPIYVMARFLMRSYGLKLISVKKYAVAAVLTLILARINDALSMPFVVLAMPIALVTSFPLLEGIYGTFVTKRHEASFIQKFMAGFVFSSGFLCSIHYAIRRTVPGAELFGFGSAFLNYIAASIILPVFAIQELNKEKTERLEHLVKERTAELLASKIQKEKLLRVVVHDISNALQVLILQTNRLAQNEDPKVIDASSRLMKNLDAISDITKHVREMEHSKTRTIKLKPLVVEECFSEIRELFQERFENKKVLLTLVNRVPKEISISVDRVAFIHSVAANIISNALKFSHPGSEVVVTAYEDNGHVHLDVQDYGVGMDEGILSNLFEFEASFTTVGTNGERGTGFGMPLVKNYTEIFGGKVNAYSSQNKDASGTRIRVTLPAVSSVDQATSLN